MRLALVGRPGRVLGLERLLELKMLVAGAFLGADLGLHSDSSPRGLGGDLLAQVREVGRHLGHGLGGAQIGHRLDRLQDHLLAVNLLELEIERHGFLPLDSLGSAFVGALLEVGLEGLEDL